jgi:hypothetical protein
VAGCCECGDEPSDSGTRELESKLVHTFVGTFENIVSSAWVIVPSNIILTFV